MATLTRNAQRAASGMTIAEHLAEARKRLLISFAAILLGAVIAFVFYSHILSWLQHPYCNLDPHNCKFLVLGPLDGLSLRIKIGFFGGLVLASPVVFFEIWRFITPGLKQRERRYAIPFVVASVIFFVAGCAMAFYSFGHALRFLQAIGGPELQAHYQPNQYLSLVTLMMAAFGITFEFPVLLVSLQLAGAVTPATLLKHWRVAVGAIVVASGVFTPSGDPFSMMVLMVPLIIFYFGSIAVGKLFRR